MDSSDQSSQFQKRLAAQIKVRHDTEEYSIDDVDLPRSHVYKVTVRRAMAYAIDSFLLWLISFIAVLIAGEGFMPVGLGGFWIGIVASALYFGYFDSRLGCGRSIGKRLLGIEVRRLNGLPLDELSAVVRFSPFMAVGVLSHVAGGLNPSSIPFAATLFILWLAVLSIIVLCLCHPQRRGLQDIIADSIVIHAGVEFEAKPAKLRTSIAILVILGIVSAAGIVSLRWYAFTKLYFKDLDRATDSLYKLSDIARPRAYLTPLTSEKEGQGRKLHVSAHVKDYKRFSDKKRARLLAEGINLALKSSSSIPHRVTEIIVTLNAGYSIGLWGLKLSDTFDFPVASEASQTIQYRVVPGKSQQPKAPPSPAGKIPKK